MAIREAIQARKDQLAGKPEDLIREIIRKSGAKSFGPIFREFHDKHAIYGFGDLQVKRLYDAVQNS